jgi:polyphosphate kinase 2 (PPK2 family)
MLHISKDEQRERLQERIDDPSKNWKFAMGDLDARKKWSDYQRAYARALEATSTEHAPWYVIPGDNKTHRNLMIARLLVKTLQDMKLAVPPPDPALKGLVVS